jgi:hypothetical protein
MKYELPGEPLTDVFPAHVETVVFHGVEVTRIVGTEEQVTGTTNMLDELYGHDERRTFGDAQHIGYCRVGPGTAPIPMYALIVLRKVFG